MLMDLRFTPSCPAIFAASPASEMLGRPLCSLTTSRSTQRTPRRQPVPSAFIAASLAAKRPAYRSNLFLNRSQYSISLGVKTRSRNRWPWRSIAARTRGTSAISTPRPMIKKFSSPASAQTLANFDYTYTLMVAAKGSATKKKKPKKRSPRKAGTSQWTERVQRGLRILQVPALAKLPWLVHGFSTRVGGVSKLEGKRVLNLGFTEWDARDNVKENRRRLQAAVGAQDFKLVSLLQFHSDAIAHFEAAPTEPSRADASVTKIPGLLLAVQTADCVPILLVDPKNRAVAAVHAGWRGTLARIVEKAIGRMQMEFGSQSAHLLPAIGPAVGGCCDGCGTAVTAAFSGHAPGP